MALLYFEGLDLYNGDWAAWREATSNNIVWNFVNNLGGGYTPFVASGRYGGSSFSGWTGGYFSHGGQLTFTNMGVKTELWVGMAIRDYSGGGQDNQDFIGFTSSGGDEIKIRYSTTNQVWSILKGDNTVLFTQANMVNMGNSGNPQWHYCEVRYKYGTTTGEVELWLDNVRYANLTNINTVTYGNDNGITGVRLHNVSNYTRMLIDDFYILDTTGSSPTNTRLGDLRIYSLPMNNDAGPNNGTPSTGNTHYGVVSDNNLNTYVSIPNSTSNSTMFGHSTMPVTATAAIGMNIIAYARKSDAGSANGHLKISANNVSSNGQSRLLLTTTQAFRESFTTDTSGAPWTVNNINTSKIGWEVE